MAFKSYKTISEVIKEFNLIYREGDFISLHSVKINDYFRSEIEFVLREVNFDNSEYAVCENLIYPLLKEVWKPYKDDLMLWSHQAIAYNERLSGTPDYVVAKRSPRGKVVFEQPYFIVVEAKRDNFTEGWVQCLVELVAAQKINDDLTKRLFGIVSNGEIWEFGKLEGELFTKNMSKYLIQDLERVFAAVDYVFRECREISIKLELDPRLLQEVGDLGSNS